MNKRIELPVWLVALHLLTLIGLVVVLIVPTLRPVSRVVTVIEVRVTATPEPVTATVTSVPATATPLPPTATMRPPIATAVPCEDGGVAGVDCSLDVDGLAVTVVSLERSPVFTVTTETGEEIPYVPKDEVNDEFLTVHLALPAGTIKSDLNTWFEDGGAHAPQLVDASGEVYGYGFALVENSEDGFGVALVFVVAKDAKGLVLIIQGKYQVDLSLVTDTTIAAEETPPPAGGPTPTSLFSNP